MGGIDRLPSGWTAAQRRVILGMLIFLLGYLCFESWRRPVYVSDPPPDNPPRADEIADRIDPNSADLPTLMALPTLGEKRAREIITYRERVIAIGQDTIAFRTSTDLLKIKGIGGVMLSNLKPYLIFPDERQATTRP